MISQFCDLSRYYYFNPHAIPPLILGVFILVLAIYVFNQNRRSSINIAFSIFGLSIFLWFFGNAMIYFSKDDTNIINFWCRYCVNLGVVFIPANIYFFSVSMTKTLNINKWRVSLSYLVSSFLYLTVIKSNYFVTGFKKYYWGWYSQFGPASFIYLIFFFIVLLLSVKSFLSALKKLPPGTERNRVKYVFIGLALANLGSIDILPGYGILVYPLGCVFIFIFAILIAFAIVKYKLMVMTPALAADTIIDTMADSLVVFSLEGNILMVNRVTGEFLGYKQEELIGRPVNILFAEKDLFSGEGLKALTTKGRIYNYELNYLTKNNDRIPVSLNAGAIIDRDGAVLGIAGIARDIRETKKLQSQLIQSAKMSAVGQLGAGIAHELNNPLGGILGYAQFMLEKIKQPDFGPEEFRSCKGYIESIEKESSRSKNIISSLLRFSRKSMINQPELMDISLALEDTLAIIGHQMEVSNIKITTSLQPGLSKIMGVVNLIQQVFANIILNAQQAMPTGGELKITAQNIMDEKTKVTSMVKIEFTDTGCGISEENLSHIFEPFFSTKAKEKSVGLGLAICYQIIQDHKGKIEVKSQVGKGSTFTITLPIR